MTRKELVRALEANWAVKATYLGVPSYAYEIKYGEETFYIDRHGVIRNQEGREFSAEEFLGQIQAGPIGETAPIDRDDSQVEGYKVEMPLADHTQASLRNLVNMLASKQQLLVSAFGLTQPLLDNRMAEDLNQRPIENLDSFQTVWTELGPQRCFGLKLDFEKQTLTMKLLKDNPMPDEMAAFHDLAVCMNENARMLKYSSFKPAQEDNPKFALRTWLLRLGMNGDAFKTTRKVLLARLSGSAAFRTPAEEEKHKARLLAKKLKQCEGDGDVC